MKGSTHLAIGVAIGAAAAAHYPFTLEHAAIYVAVSALSALSPDLDGPSMLSAKIGQFSKWLREMLYWSGLLLIVILAWLYFAKHFFVMEYSLAALSLFLLGLIIKDGLFRNIFVCAIGVALAYVGLSRQMPWLIGFGLFVAVAPWLKHRGLTHTVWALALWAYIGSGLEEQLRVEGIMLVATAGYLSHLVADTLTPSGVKWLYPILKKSFKLPIA
ncbi:MULTISPECIES: metal-dependent hydrolase [Paenibacillus]|uniref:Metal-binding protein n=1 Tax=Paenibacillus albilobatus TaxID=2716884 RepID=A0A920CB58_9BACL|nr:MULTISPECIES: metal-dependent hydrolase [Paenibacillus]GIO30147.1 metal-binding protein [Paenibacillus albilobatus]